MTNTPQPATLLTLLATTLLSTTLATTTLAAEYSADYRVKPLRIQRQRSPEPRQPDRHLRRQADLASYRTRRSERLDASAESAVVLQSTMKAATTAITRTCRGPAPPPAGARRRGSKGNATATCATPP